MLVVFNSEKTVPGYSIEVSVFGSAHINTKDRCNKIFPVGMANRIASTVMRRQGRGGDEGGQKCLISFYYLYHSS
jgi:hypothetical protein